MAIRKNFYTKHTSSPAVVYKALMDSFFFPDPVNKASFESIESCMFILCLDKCLPLSFNHQQSVEETSMRQRDDVSLAMQMIHGHGAKHNSANRWYEKTMQVTLK
jgi:hypothetical protein